MNRTHQKRTTRAPGTHYARTNSGHKKKRPAEAGRVLQVLGYFAASLSCSLHSAFTSSPAPPSRASCSHLSHAPLAVCTR